MRKSKLNLLVMFALAVLVSASSSVTGATATINPTDDAYVHSGNPGTNYGASGTLYVGDENWNSPVIITRSYLEFDLTVIPSGSTITSALLYLHCGEIGNPSSMDVNSHFVSDDSWTEGTITWGTSPGHNAVPTDTTTVNSTAAWFSWDVTADATSEHAGDGKLSIMMKDANEMTQGRWAGFGSKETSSTGFEPYLEVEYDEPLPEDQGAVSFSVNGHIDPHFDGVPNSPGWPYFNPPYPGAPPGAGPYPHVRLPTVPQAEGLVTPRPGDVNDYRAAGIPSEGEIFQSEPNRSKDAAGGPISNVPSNTNNQILKDVALGLWTQNSNV
ncbi:MAG: CBM96 family carbohydrate-binding protein, partial [Planctomycetota bacterium]